jgi:hypothetical protein
VIVVGKEERKDEKLEITGGIFLAASFAFEGTALSAGQANQRGSIGDRLAGLNRFIIKIYDTLLQQVLRSHQRRPTKTLWEK